MKTEEISINHYSFNRIRRKLYRLNPNEIVLFEELCVRQEESLKIGQKEFPYSLSNMEEDTNIKRRTLETIVSKFTSIGFLSHETKPNKFSRTFVKYYRVDFSVLAQKEILSQFINENSCYFKNMLSYFKKIAKLQY